MKTTMKFINLTFLFLLIPFLLLSQTSKQSGKWSDENSWVGEVFPGNIIENNYNLSEIIIMKNHKVVFDKDDYKNYKNSNLTINKNNFSIKVYGTLVINAQVTINNNLYIYIAPNAKIVINGDIIADNNLEIAVDSSGVFDVKGNLAIKNNASVSIDGVFNAESISGKNNNKISGNGVVYSDKITGVEIQDFDGIIVGDNTNLTFPAPINFQAYNLDYALLNWDFNHFDGFEDYKFIGFQVFKNCIAPTHYDGIIIGNDLNDISKEVTHSDFMIIEGEVYIYYVRAVYQINNSEEIIYSPISNLAKLSKESVLPIKLVFFDAQIEQNSVAIQWATATEINNDFFSIEKSNDMKNWDVIATQKGAGNSNQFLSYEFQDMNLMQGISYYRLKQTDFDGQFEYFSPVVVKNELGFTNEIEVNIYPNPSHGIFNIQINSEIEKGEIKITNNLGQIVASYPITNNQHFPIDITQFGKGLYQVLILDKSSILQSHKLVVR